LSQARLQRRQARCREVHRCRYPSIPYPRHYHNAAWRSMYTRALALLRTQRPEGKAHLPAYLFPVQFTVFRLRRTAPAPPPLGLGFALGLVVTTAEGVGLDAEVHLAREG